MDYQYHPSINIDCIKFTNVLITQTRYQAESIIENLYPYFIDMVVYSLDDTFPKNEKLRERCRVALQTNNKLNLVLLGITNFSALPSFATTKVLYLDDFIISSVSLVDEKIMLKLIINSIKSHFEQSKKIVMGKISHDYFQSKLKHLLIDKYRLKSLLTC